MADATKQEMVNAQKLKSQIPPDCMPGHCHSHPEIHHVGVHTKCNVAARRVPMREMPVLMRQNRSKCLSAKSIQRTDTQKQYPFCGVLRLFLARSLFINRNFSTWCNTDFLNAPSSNVVRNGFCQRPKLWRFFSCETAARISALVLDK